jgi:hypothetical protein
LKTHFPSEQELSWDREDRFIIENKMYGLLAIMALIGFGSYCTLKLLFPRVMVLPQV